MDSSEIFRSYWFFMFDKKFGNYDISHACIRRPNESVRNDLKQFPVKYMLLGKHECLCFAIQLPLNDYDIFYINEFHFKVQIGTKQIT
jgi:hypothetical protein